jgi:hypothetical protein
MHSVYFYANSLILLQHDAPKQASPPYQIKSISSHPLNEEISGYLKKETQQHFLHAPEFTFFTIPQKLLLIPKAIWEDSLIENYWGRMYEPLEKGFELQAVFIKSYQVQIVCSIPTWINAYVHQQFNIKQSGSIFEAIFELSAIAGTMDVLIIQDIFILSLRTEQELRYLDMHPFEQTEDIVYTILNVVQKQWNPIEITTMYMHAFCPNSVRDSLVEQLGRIENLSRIELHEPIIPFV